METNKHIDKTTIKILHFDDEDRIAKSIDQNLRLIFDWNISLVSDANSLFRELNKRHYDLLIMDILAPMPHQINDYVSFSPEEMRDMDYGNNVGVVLADKIWNMDTYQSIPILFLSSRTYVPHPKKEGSNGIRLAFIRKPELASIINETIEELLTK